MHAHSKIPVNSVHGWLLHLQGGLLLISNSTAFIQGYHVVGDHAHSAVVLNLLSGAHCYLSVSALRAAEVAVAD